MAFLPGCRNGFQWKSSRTTTTSGLWSNGKGGFEHYTKTEEDVSPFWWEKSDEMPGIIPPRRKVAYYKNLAKEAKQADSARCDAIATELAHEIKDEEDPMLRAEIIGALGDVRSPTTVVVLRAAMGDSSDRVRIRACEAWGKAGGEPAVAALANAMESDDCVDVRLAAAKALGKTRDQGAVAVLGRGLRDRDPAIQYRSMQSLKEVTGEDFGDNVGHWQEYIATGRPPEGAEVSIADRVMGVFR